MLNGRLALHDCRDIEALCASILARRGGNELPWHTREEALAYLIATAWELSTTYDPKRNPGHNHPKGGFTGYAAHILQLRYTDWLRTGYRTNWQFANHEHQREKPTLLPYDHNTNDRQLDGPHPTLGMDPTNDRSPDLARILRTRNSRPPRHHPTPDQMGTHPTSRAA